MSDEQYRAIYRDKRMVSELSGLILLFISMFSYTRMYVSEKVYLRQKIPSHVRLLICARLPSLVHGAKMSACPLRKAMLKRVFDCKVHFRTRQTADAIINSTFD